MKRYLPLFLLLLAAPPAVAATGGATPVGADRIVAVVNSEAITLYELRTRVALVERQLRGQNVQLPEQSVLEKQILERMIVDRAQLQLAKEVGVQVSDIEVDAALARIASSNGLSPADFRKAIERDGVVWDKFREEIRQEIIISRLRDREVDSQLTVSEGEIDNYLESAESANGADVVQVAHIIVRVPEQASAQQLERSRARVQQAMDQLKAGEEFARVAAAFSDAPDGLKGGVMDARPVDRLPNLYADAVRTMKPGETSAVLRSPAGYHIVRLLDRRGGAAPTQALKQTHARHILIKVNELMSDNDAHQRVVVLKERLDNGADFAELARVHSNDLSAAKGGDLGWLFEGDTVPEFEKAMNALKINEISGPVRSPFGWHLIQVLERRTEDATKERRRQMARQTLRERKSDEAYQDWLRQLRDRAYVEYRLEEK
ncbi:MAG TPA: peptidylprolyl isomerase [Rhodocyclaceae bacterium]|nr:peptidylprolyl isomerase [Rhodocyclaceae bacterium]